MCIYMFGVNNNIKIKYTEVENRNRYLYNYDKTSLGVAVLFFSYNIQIYSGIFDIIVLILLTIILLNHAGACGQYESKNNNKAIVQFFFLRFIYINLCVFKYEAWLN